MVLGQHDLSSQLQDPGHDFSLDFLTLHTRWQALTAIYPQPG